MGDCPKGAKYGVTGQQTEALRKAFNKGRGGFVGKANGGWIPSLINSRL